MQPQDIMRLADFWPTRILLTAAELDIFAQLVDPAEATAVASAINADPRATERLLDALTALHCIEKHGALYSIPPALRDALLPGPHCIVSSVLHRANLWQSWHHLTEVVRSGQPAVEPYEDDARPDEQVREFIAAMAVGGRVEAPRAVAALDLAGVTTVLDIGGGPGVYAAEFCKASPDIQATILDLPRVCDIARENLADTPFAGRVGFVKGEVRTVAETAALAPTSGAGYDLTFTSSLIHSMDPEQVRQLFTRMAAWTKPGGRVVVKDFFLDDSRTEPAQAAIFAINMLVNTPGGMSYTWTECEEWLREALAASAGSVTSIERIELPDSASGMIVAVKA